MASITYLMLADLFIRSLEMISLGENKRSQLTLRIKALEPLVEKLTELAENINLDEVIKSIYKVYFGYESIKGLPFYYGATEINKLISLSEELRKDINECQKCINNTTFKIPEEVSKYINEISQIYTQYEDILKDKTI